MKTLTETLLTNRNSVMLTESQEEEYQRFLADLNREFDKGGPEAVDIFLRKCQDEGLYEGFFGGIAGFLAGPSVGKIVARALGLEHGILYDLLTSRLVSAAIGSAIQKELKNRGE